MEDHLEQNVLGLGMGEDERTLAEVVQHQRHEDAGPGPHNRLPAQVAHVGVKSLAARGAQDDLRKDEEARYAVVEKEPDGIPGIYRLGNAGYLDDRGDTRDGQ